MHPAPASDVPVDPNLASTRRVREAIARTARLLPEHWERLLASRTPGPAAYGSVVDVPDIGLAAALAHATWTGYFHPAVADGCAAFWTRNLTGTLGLVEIDLLPESTDVELRDAHETDFDGACEACVAGATGDRAEGVCLILGMEGDAEVVFTLHPGAPIPPSRVPSQGMAGRRVAPSDAMALGLRTAKIVATL